MTSTPCCVSGSGSRTRRPEDADRAAILTRISPAAPNGVPDQGFTSVPARWRRSPRRPGPRHPLAALNWALGTMDFSLLFDPEYLPIIAGTLVGFALLAALLLVPVYRFLERERKVAQKWTPEALAERMQEQQASASNGTATDVEDTADEVAE